VSQLAQAGGDVARERRHRAQATRAYQIAEVRFARGWRRRWTSRDSRLLLQQAEANAATAARDREVARLRLALLKDLPLSQQGRDRGRGVRPAAAGRRHAAAALIHAADRAGRRPGRGRRPGNRHLGGLPMNSSHTRPAGARILHAALAAATLGALAACGSDGDAEAASAAGAAATPSAVTVGPENVAVVARDSIQSGPAISGSLQPERQATIRAEAGGTVTSALVEPGQRVTRGQTLARIETAGLGEQAISARAGVASAQLAFETAQRNVDRSERLLSAGAIAERDAESARSAAAAAAAQLSAARAQSTLANRQFGNATARAPFAGVVGVKRVSTGDVVSPGTEMYSVVDPSSMRLEGNVPADQLGQVSVGAPVRFSVTGYPDRTFVGRITRVAPVADPSTRQVQILASIPNAGNTLVGGLFAEGRVASQTREGLLVPADAIDARGIRPTVVRVKGGRVERVNVEVGLRDDARELVEVRTGLAAGDTLLRGAAQGISNGTTVRVAAVGDQAARPAGAAAVPAGGSPAGQAAGQAAGPAGSGNGPSGTPAGSATGTRGTPAPQR
jgi:RND family efflux transporter MFP subunit